MASEGLSRLLVVLVVVWWTSRASNASSVFLKPPVNTTAPLGSRLVLACVVDRVGDGPRPEWTLGGMGAGLTHGDDDAKARLMEGWPSLSIVGEDVLRDWSLEINPVKLSHDALFECQYNKQRAVASVKVVVPPEFVDIIGGPVIEVTEHSQVNITCVADGARPAAKIVWEDWHGVEIAESIYHSRRLKSEEKLFTSNASITLSATRNMNAKKLRCVAWNQVGKKEAEATLNVNYGPSVTVERVGPDIPWEGESAAYRCVSDANPKVVEKSVTWYLDGQQVSSGSSTYTLINMTKAFNGRIINCSVENEYGKASAIAVINVYYAPNFLIEPESQNGDDMASITLECAVDSNPEANYTWTKGDSNRVVGSGRNYSFYLRTSTSGDYACHASVVGYNDVVVHSKVARVRMRERPSIWAEDEQQGVIGNDVHVNCVIEAVPKIEDGVVWKFHGQELNGHGNPHYSVVTSPVLSGHMSTLIIREALVTDFGEYECSASNEKGDASKRINVVAQTPFSPVVALSAVLGSLALVALLLIFFVILCRRRRKDAVLSQIQVHKPSEKDLAIGFDQQSLHDSQGGAPFVNPHHLRTLLNSHYSESNGGSDTSSLPRSAFSNVDATTEVDPYGGQPHFRRPQQPKPDVISFAPLSTSRSNNSSSLLLKVADPRNAASYGNNRLVQNDYSSYPYTTPTSTTTSFIPSLDTTSSSSLLRSHRLASLTRRKVSDAFSDSSHQPQEESESVASSVASSSSIPRLVLRDSCSHFLKSIRNNKDNNSGFVLSNKDSCQGYNGDEESTDEGKVIDETLATPV